MAEHVRDYVKSCDVCQRMKAPRHKPYGLLAPLPQPEKPWQHVAMDFVGGLPPSIVRGKVYDAILVVTDRFSKMVRYLACTTETDAPELADMLIDTVFSKLGFPSSIVSDRGSLFTSKFWSTFCYYIVVKRRLSTAFHPQTDGQTERANQTLECYLRCYANHQQDDWAEYLPCAEFAYNRSVHAATGKSPFDMIMRYVPQFRFNVSATLREGENDAAH